MATSLKLPLELKSRVASAAKQAGKSPHSFMLEAIEAQTARAERRQAFLDAAEDAARDVDEGGAVASASEVHRAMAKRARGTPAKKARVWRK